MVATKYTYSKTTDFGGSLDTSLLVAEIAASAIDTGANPVHIDTLADAVDVWFASALSSGDQTTLGTVVGAHGGPVAGSTLRFLASSPLIIAEIAITETSSWQMLGGLATKPSFFANPVSGLIARITADVKTAGTGVELKLTEDNGSTEVDLTSSPYSVADNSSVWTIHKFNSDVTPRDSDNRYCLWGRLNAATSASARFASAVLLGA